MTRSHWGIIVLVILILLTLFFIVGETSTSSPSPLAVVTNTITDLSPRSQTASTLDSDSALVAHYTFDDANNLGVDTSGRGNNGTLQGANGLPTATAGKVGSGALNFDGVDDYINTNNKFSDIIMHSDKTIYVWVKPASSSGDVFCIGRGYGATCGLSLKPVNGVWVMTYRNIFNNSVTHSFVGSTVLVGQWSNLSLVQSGAEITFYVNGMLIGSVNDGGVADNVFVTTFIAARNNYSDAQEFFSGSIDDFRMYSRALNSAEIGQLYTTASSVDNIITNVSGQIKEPLVTSGIVSSPIFSPPAHSFKGSTQFSLLSDTPEADIYYTIDGTTPTASSIRYTGNAITITSTTNIKAIAIKSGMGDSPISSSVYELDGSFGSDGITYYVSISGDDTNPGMEALPFRTIQKAADLTRAGDTVIVNTGNYDEIVKERSSGTNTAHITYQARGIVNTSGFLLDGQYLYIDGFKLNGHGLGRDVGAIHMGKNGSNCHVSNITIMGTPGITNGFAGISMDYYGAATDNNIFDHISITNSKSHYVVFLGQNNSLINSTISGVTGWDVFRIFGTGHVIKNNIISVSNPDSNPNHADIFQAFGDNGNISKNILVENNYVIQGIAYQLGNMTDDLQNGNVSHWTFRNNVFANISRTMNLYAPDFSFYNNTFYHSGWQSNWTVIYGGSRAGHADNLIFKNNIFYNSCDSVNRDMCGGYAGGSVTGLIADYNFLAGSNGSKKNSSNWNQNNLELHGINGGNPAFADESNFLGPDGISFTSDDGLKPIATSLLCGTGESGVDIGAYSCSDSLLTSCTSFTYSSWGTCSNNSQSRTVLSSSPAGCSGGNPILAQACTVVILTGDFNHDGLVNSLDFSALSAYWNQQSSTYDLTGDNLVNTLDYVVLVKNWSK